MENNLQGKKREPSDEITDKKERQKHAITPGSRRDRKNQKKLESETVDNLEGMGEVKAEKEEKKLNRFGKPARANVYEADMPKNQDKVENFALIKRNKKFESYYKAQLSDIMPKEEDFNLFMTFLAEKLPSVFRVNTANNFWEKFREIIATDKYQEIFFKEEEEKVVKIAPLNLCNIPAFKDTIFNMNINRRELRKTDSLNKFHKFIQNSCDAGLISRQEAVSMIPPLLMDVKQGDKVLDMCAAPGSKTAQFLECIYKNYDFLNPNEYINDSGFVLANDNNITRANMMIHQLKRLNTAGMVVISHDGQTFPSIFTDDKSHLECDKILCDVPCSSDAVLRKLPNKWMRWSTKDGYGLHDLQLSILKRGLNLLKEGGTIIYSTCSFNPIENEAVVTEIMRKYSDHLEIVDMRDHFTGFSHAKFHPGLLKWKVFIDDPKDRDKLIEIPSKEDPLYQTFKGTVHETCFPDSEDLMKKYGIDNCIRLLPQDCDTSGFFITVFRKKKQIEINDKNWRQNKEKAKERQFVFLNEKFPEYSTFLKDYYGLLDQFPLNQLITHSDMAKRVNFISKGVLNLLHMDKRNQLNLVNLGVKMFHLNKKLMHQNDEYCKFRLSQDGIFYLIPFLTKRIAFANQESFKQLLTIRDLAHDDIAGDDNLKEELKATQTGSIVIVCLKNKPQTFNFKNISHEEYLKFLKDSYEDSVCCFNARARIQTQISKEHHHIFNLKYDIQEDPNAKYENIDD